MSRQTSSFFTGIVFQYVFISSASVYQQPSPFYPLVEDAPLGNTGWQYATDKIACEDSCRAARRLCRFADGIERSLAWFDADSARKTVDAERDALLDRIIARST